MPSRSTYAFQYFESGTRTLENLFLSVRGSRLYWMRANKRDKEREREIVILSCKLFQDIINFIILINTDYYIRFLIILIIFISRRLIN